MIKQNKLFFLVLSMLTAMLILVGIYFDNSIQDQIKPVTQLRYNSNSNISPLPVLDIEKISEKIDMEDVSFCSELDSTDVRGEDITPVLTNGFYFENYGGLIFGRGISEEDIQLKKRCVVISDSLSLRIFFITNAVDKTLYIDGQDYKIIGVYRKSNGILGELSNDNKERVYIPYTVLENNKYYRVDQISYSNSAFSAALIEQMNLEAYYSVDFTEKSKVISNFQHIINFTVFAAVAAILLRLWYYALKHLAAEINGALKNEYFFRLLRAKPQKPLLFVLTAVFVPSVLIAVFFLANFSIYIVPEYLPNENIFNFSHYFEMIIKNANAVNALALNGNPYYNNLYIRSFNVLMWLTVIFITAFAVWVYFVFRQINTMIQKHDYEE